MRLSLYKSLHVVHSIDERRDQCQTMLKYELVGGSQKYNWIKRVTQPDFLKVLTHKDKQLKGTHKDKRPKGTSYEFIIFCRNCIMHLQQNLSILINVLQFLSK